MSGNFYVIRLSTGDYFKQVSAVGRKCFCTSFSDAAKIFDCDIKDVEEVRALARDIGGSVETFTYERQDADPSTEVLKMNLI